MLVYIFLGGLTSAIYNEVLQFFMIVLGFTPLVFLALKDVGGWTALQQKLDPGGRQASISPPARGRIPGSTWAARWRTRWGWTGSA